ncbi:hypothetical protein VTK73DRAFT_6394 [Phialemonium thermophilum]|uniref:Protein required for cell viability n=1 Tax=Phialemonium thermophilum TaxID=223376 RepID=A0ABR3XWA1_9PEZI
MGQPGKRAQQELIQSIAEQGQKAFNPESSPQARAEAQQEFDNLIQRTRTIPLISALNVLIRPSYTPTWLRLKLMDVLTLLPLRPDGVRGTLEFVFAVHPSNTQGPSDSASPQKQGASITHEALSVATRVLSTPPSSVTPDVWFSGISQQLMKLLDGEEGPDLIKVASFVIGFGILGRKDFGAPGSVGWKWFADPILRRIHPSLEGPHDSSNETTEGLDEIIDLSKDRVLVSHTDLIQALNRLHSLLMSHPNPGLCKRLLRPILLPLWALCSWPNRSARTRDAVSQPAKELLEVYLKLAPVPDTVRWLMHHLNYRGGDLSADTPWIYSSDVDGEVHIVEKRGISSAQDREPLPFLEEIDAKVDSLLDLLDSSISDIDMSSLFLDIVKTWLEVTRSEREGNLVLTEELTDARQNTMERVVETRMLQKMIEKFPGTLATRSDHALELVSKVLDEASMGDHEVIPVALSILSLVVSAPAFRRAKLNDEMRSSLESTLDRLSRNDDDLVRTQARDLQLLLRYRDEAQDWTAVASDAPERKIDDRKTYNLAMSYITQADAPPPVRSEGLNLLSILVSNGSDVLDIQTILVLLSTLLGDKEDYINLRVIKLFTQLADRHSQLVTNEVVEHFVDAKERASTDTRLRFGEALVQIIERLGETFTGDTAKRVGEALLATAGRRGYRPKTLAKQAREDRIRKAKHNEAEEAWGGEVPDLSDDVSEEEKARNEILNKIVEGWESKRGAEDVRIRASALSILATAMETNIGGLGASLVSSSVDLCVNILTLEPELEKGILRRGAVYLILSFIKALDHAREQGRILGFGLTAQSREDITRVLSYVSETDNDGLVRQNSRDVMESLQNLDLARLLSNNKEELEGTTLTRLAGLTLNPEASSGSVRHKIVEID